MIFQKSGAKNIYNSEEPTVDPTQYTSSAEDTVETVVGPSVNVEGDFASEGNIIVKGTVSGSVHTSRHLVVEAGGRIMADVRAGTAQIAGEVKGNMKVKENLELMSTARVVGDIEVKVLAVEAGALICGKIMMPGLEAESRAMKKTIGKKFDEQPVMMD